MLVFDADHFRAFLADRRSMVKSALLVREVIAEIGKVHSDKILF